VISAPSSISAATSLSFGSSKHPSAWNTASVRKSSLAMFFVSVAIKGFGAMIELVLRVCMITDFVNLVSLCQGCVHHDPMDAWCLEILLFDN